jgi:hypothetical protein
VRVQCGSRRSAGVKTPFSCAASLSIIVTLEPVSVGERERDRQRAIGRLPACHVGASHCGGTGEGLPEGNRVPTSLPRCCQPLWGNGRGTARGQSGAYQPATLLPATVGERERDCQRAIGCLPACHFAASHCGGTGEGRSGGLEQLSVSRISHPPQTLPFATCSRRARTPRASRTSRRCFACRSVFDGESLAVGKQI